MTDITILKTHETLDLLDSLLAEGDRVFFSRWGDAEFNFMAGRAAVTNGQTIFSRSLQFDLLSSFCIQDRRYVKAITGIFQTEPHFEEGVIGGVFNKPYAEQFVLSLEPDVRVYANPIVFNYSVLYNQKKLLDFLAAHVRDKRTLFVGSLPVKSMERAFGPIAHYVHVPSKNAYGTFAEWFPRMLDAVDDVEVVVICAGVAANVAQGILWKMGVGVHCIDFGSFIDALDGIGSRAYIRKYGDAIRRLFDESNG